MDQAKPPDDAADDMSAFARVAMAYGDAADRHMPPWIRWLFLPALVLLCAAGTSFIGLVDRDAAVPLFIAFGIAMAIAVIITMPLRRRAERIVDEQLAALARDADATADEAMLALHRSMTLVRRLEELTPQPPVAGSASDVAAELRENQQTVLQKAEHIEEIRTLFVAELAGLEARSGRAQWRLFALGLLCSIPIGVAINLLTG